MDGHGHLGTVGLLLDDAVDVDAVAAAVHSGDLGYSLPGAGGKKFIISKREKYYKKVTPW